VASENLIPYSSDFSVSGWETFVASKAGAATVDGVDCYELSHNSGQNSNIFYRNVVTAGTVNTMQAKVRAKSGSATLRLSVGNNQNSTDQSPDFVIGESWETISWTSGLISNAAASGLRNGSAGGEQSFYVAWVQIEESSVPTSYIPTNGTTVSRAAESVEFAASAFDTEGHTMTIPAANVDATATNFPVYLDLAQMPSQFWDAVRAGDGTADSLRVFVPNSGNYVEKPREIVSADSTLGDGGATDSTGTVSPVANGAITASDSSGQLGDATSFSGSSADYFSLGDPSQYETTDFSVTAWIKADTSGLDDVIFGNVDNAANGYAVGLKNQQVQFFYDTSAAIRGWYRSTSTITYGQFDYIFAARSESSAEGYFSVNSGARESVSTTNEAIFYGPAEARIGQRENRSGEFDGILDEIRVTGSVLPAEWITQEYANQSDPANFYSIAANDAGPVTAPVLSSPYAASITATSIVPTVTFTF